MPDASDDRLQSCAAIYSVLTLLAYCSDSGIRHWTEYGKRFPLLSLQITKICGSSHSLSRLTACCKPSADKIEGRREDGYWFGDGFGDSFSCLVFWRINIFRADGVRKEEIRGESAENRNGPGFNGGYRFEFGSGYRFGFWFWVIFILLRMGAVLAVRIKKMNMHEDKKLVEIREWLPHCFGFQTLFSFRREKNQKGKEQKESLFHYI